MTLIALVRHGETDWNAHRRLQGSTDVPMNDTGRGQARAAADFLRAVDGGSWDVLRHSPLQRAAETGVIVAACLGIGECRVLPAVTERDWGCGEGVAEPEYVRRWAHTPGQDPVEVRNHIPGVEPEGLVTARGRFAIGTLTEQYPGGRVVVTSHGTFLRMTLADLLAEPVARVPNGGVMVIAVEPGAGGLRTRVVAANFPWRGR